VTYLCCNLLGTRKTKKRNNISMATSMEDNLPGTRKQKKKNISPRGEINKYISSIITFKAI
jgi:hypothetical protein